MAEELQEKQYKPGILRFPLIRMLWGFAVLIGCILGVQLVIQLIPGESIAQSILGACIVSAVAVAAYYALVRLAERRPVSELAWRHAPAELLGGLGLGALMFAATVGILSLFGFYRIVEVNPAAALLPALAGSIVSGFIEEILFRAVVYRLLEEWLNTWWALGLSAVLFGLLHLLNPNATLWGAIAVGLEGGIVLAAGYVVTRRLWLPIGIHIAWNYVQAGVFGIAVSGNEAIGGLFRSTLSGPTLLAGGEFGAEASVFAVVITLIASGIMLRMAYQSGQFLKRDSKPKVA
jgi:hypothetical protein